MYLQNDKELSPWSTSALLLCVILHSYIYSLLVDYPVLERRWDRGNKKGRKLRVGLSQKIFATDLSLDT